MDSSWVTWRDRESELAGLTVAVLFGGAGGEREVSITSGTSMATALEGTQRVGEVHRVEISPSGSWCLGGRDRTALEGVQALPKDTLFLLGLHGGPGEDGRMQAFLEVCGKRYTGSGPMASATCMDKRRAREAVEAVGLSVAKGHLVKREAFRADSNMEIAAILALGPGPWFVKPNCGGSSVAVTRACDRNAIEQGLLKALEIEPDVLVEQAQPGLEVTCGVVGNRGEHLETLPLVEILPKDGRFFDYEEKYAKDGASENCPPKHLAEDAIALIQSRALTAYQAAGCDGYARIDFMVEGAKEPIFLEANTLPGFTPRSLLPLAAAKSGVAFTELCLEVCSRALARFERSPIR